MCSRNQCGSIWSALTLILLCICAAVPWYLETSQVHLGETDICDVNVMTGWQTAYCSVGPVNSTCQKTLGAAICGDDSYSWRNKFECRGDHCSQRAQTYDIALYLLVTSLFSMAVLTIAFFIRCCCPVHGKSYLMIIVSLVGFLSLVASVGYFWHKLPEAYKADYGGECPSENKPLPSLSFGEGPCNQFWGEYEFKVLSGQYIHFWIPLGWIVGVSAIPFYAIVLCLSCLRASSARYNTDYHLHHEGGQTYV